MSSKITEQNLKNQRFRKTEESIIINFCLLKGNLSVKKLIRTAKISHSTFYRHHSSIHEIIPSYEQYILKKYRNIVKKNPYCKKAQLRYLFRNTLIFLVVHQKIMNFLSRYGSPNFTEALLLALSPKLLSTGKITSKDMLDIYLKEVAVIIDKWQQNGYKKEEITKTVDKIMFLTNTARIRLGPVVN